jgi:hypothetical protein
MKERTKTHVLRVTETIVVTCDICKDAKSDGWEWESEGSWNRNTTAIESIVGNVFPEGDMRERTSIDVCPTCFETKVVPVLEQALGVKFRKTDNETGD